MRTPTSIAAVILVALCATSPSLGQNGGKTRARPSRGEVLARAKSILGDSVYQKELPQKKEETRKGGDEIRVDGGGGGASGVGATVIWVLTWMVIFAVAILLIWAVVVALGSAGWLGSRLGKKKEPVGTVATAIGPLPSEAALESAESLVGGGDYLDAVRTLFLDSARMVHELGSIPLEKAYTNGEYLSRFGSDSPYLTVMAALAAVVDICFYGGRECTKEDWLRCRGEWEKLRPGTGGAS